VDAATLGAVGTIVVGLAAAGAALIGHRGANAASQSGAVLGGYSTLVDNLQEERDKLRDRLVETERLLAAAYAELASERADKAALHEQITALTAEKARLREQIIELGGQPT
jgi:septal ring factor EnvC (AmiA/AmiB activator)